MLFDAMPEGNEPAGTYCVLGLTNSQDYAEVYARDRPASDTPINNSPTPGLAIRDLQQSIVRGRNSRVDMQGTRCSFEANGSETTIAGVRTPLPPAGMVGIYASHTTATFTFLFVVGPQ